MKYGYFDDLNKEYVIETPRTPLPWINYLGTNGFFSLISNTSGGYCFYKDAKHRRILRYRYNNIPADNGGRYFYINDNGDCWTHSYMPMKKELDLVIYLIKWFTFSLIIGILSGSASAVFLLMLEWATKTREYNPFLIYFLPAGGFIVSLIYYFYGKEVSKGNNLIFIMYICI